MTERETERLRLIARAQRSRENIEGLFNDVAHWNLRRPSYEAIDIDPDGALHRALDEAIAIEAQLRGEQ